MCRRNGLRIRFSNLAAAAGLVSKSLRLSHWHVARMKFLACSVLDTSAKPQKSSSSHKLTASQHSAPNLCRGSLCTGNSSSPISTSAAMNLCPAVLPLRTVNALNASSSSGLESQNVTLHPLVCDSLQPASCISPENVGVIPLVAPTALPSTYVCDGRLHLTPYVCPLFTHINRSVHNVAPISARCFSLLNREFVNGCQFTFSQYPLCLAFRLLLHIASHSRGDATRAAAIRILRVMLCLGLAISAKFNYQHVKPFHFVLFSSNLTNSPKSLNNGGYNSIHHLHCRRASGGSVL